MYMQLLFSLGHTVFTVVIFPWALLFSSGHPAYTVIIALDTLHEQQLFFPGDHVYIQWLFLAGHPVYTIVICCWTPFTYFSLDTLHLGWAEN